MNLWRRLRAGWAAFRAPSEDHKESGRADEPAAVKAPPKPQSASGAPGLTDEHAERKKELKDLVKGLITIGGAIATVLVAGSQLSSIGSLDDSTEVRLFAWHQTRFAFAVVGLGLGLGGLAVAISLAVWVQTTGFVTLDQLCKYPRRRLPRAVGWRVKYRVRKAIEEDLKRRGVPGATPAQSDLIGYVATRWHEARTDEQTTRTGVLALESELQRLRTPRGAGASRTDPATAPHWDDGLQLQSLARKLADDPPPGGVWAASDALTEMQAQSADAYANATKETRNRFELVGRVLNDASYLRLSYSFRMTLKYLVLAFMLSGVGISMFAWASHPPDKPSSRSPTVTTVRLSRQDLPNLTFTNCDAATLKIDVASKPGVAVVSAASSTADTTCVITPG